VSNKEDTFFEENGHDSQEKFSMKFLAEFFFSAVEGRTIRIRTVRTVVWIWHGNRGNFDTVFEAIFKFSVVVFGPYEPVRTVDCGHGK
jgi:hypothetical protein